MKVLLFGANGQVGWELQRSLSLLGVIKACDRNMANLEDLDNLSALVDEYKPDIIVNAAGYTAVDAAETDSYKAKLINTEAVSCLADKAKKINALFVHYSTDYVFDGSKVGFYTETDKVNPLSVYGVTKYQGEDAIKDSGCKHFIFRTSWVYANRGLNFAKSIIRAASERDKLNVVCDQVGVPTSAELIADVTSLCLYKILQKEIAEQDIFGVYHLTPTGETSWHGFAKFVIIEALNQGFSFRTSPEKIFPISTLEYPLPAKRPANSLLDTQKIRDTFDIFLPSWQSHVKRFIKELKT